DPGLPGVVNNNIMQAIEGGTLRLNEGEYDNTNGILIASGPGSVVEVANITITNPTFDTSDGGRVVIHNGWFPTVTGTVTTDDVIELLGISGATHLRIIGD